MQATRLSPAKHEKTHDKTETTVLERAL